jgi:hypothetical protein
MQLSAPQFYQLNTSTRLIELKPNVENEISNWAQQLLIGADCEDPNIPCGIDLMSVNGIPSVQTDYANKVIKVTIGFNGKNVQTKPRTFEIAIPDVTVLGNTSYNTCPPSTPVLAGLNSDGSVRCKTTTEAFHSIVQKSQACEGSLTENCIPRSGRCPAGYYADVTNFKVNCKELPEVNCEAGQSLRNLKIDQGSGVSFKCGDLPSLDQIVLKLPPPEQKAEVDVPGPNPDDNGAAGPHDTNGEQKNNL